MGFWSGVDKAVDAIAKGLGRTAELATKAHQHATGDRCDACGALGEVRWVEGGRYGKKCGHAVKMRQIAGTEGMTVRNSVRKHGHAKEAVPARERRRMQ